MTQVSRLLVLVPDSMGALIEKGELTPRYYNPGNLFEEVTIMTTADDPGSIGSLQASVGTAKLSVVSHPADYPIIDDWNFKRVTRKLNAWASKGLDLAASASPDLIRCHGADWNAYLASVIKAKFGTPYVVSLHINPDENPTRRHLAIKKSRYEKRVNRFYEFVETVGLRNSDMVMPVYKPIIPYLERLHVPSWEVHYNVLDGSSIKAKTAYEIKNTTKIICVTRMISEKSPIPILEALVELPKVQLTLIGDGPLSPMVQDAIDTLGIKDQVTWFKSISNSELCQLLSEHDLFVVYTQYWELSKSVIEALLTGLPVIINERTGQPVPELIENDFVFFCSGDSDSYRRAIGHLANDQQAREALGMAALNWGTEHVSPNITEDRYVSTYKKVMQGI